MSKILPKQVVPAGGRFFNLSAGTGGGGAAGEKARSIGPPLGNVLGAALPM